MSMVLRATSATSATDDREAESPVRLWSWLLHVDPLVRRLSAGLAVAGVAALAVDLLLGAALLSGGVGMVRLCKSDAVAAWQERQALRHAMADLQRRHAAGQLSDEAYGRRAVWLTSSPAA